MDKIPESTNGEIIFEMDLDIQEDVHACLVEFAFLVRLDLHEDARQLAEDILWQHIGYFPVFAELAAFFIKIQDVWAAADLIIDLAARGILFAGTDEQEFLQMVALFAKDRLSASTLAAFSQKDNLKLEGPGVGALCSPFAEIDYNSIAQLQNVEIRLYSILVVEQHEKLSDVVEFAIDHIQKLIGFSLLREATEIFLYLCIHLHNTGQTYDILSLYNNLSELLEQRWKTLTANDETKDVLLTKTTAKVALFIALRGKIQSPLAVGRSEDIDELVQDIENSNNILLSMIADTKPSRSLIDRLHERWHVRKHPPLLEEDVPIQSRPDISNAAHPEHAQDQGLYPSDNIQIFRSTGAILISQPDGSVYVQVPKRETYVQSSQEAVYVQGPQETVYVQVPQQITYVQNPQETVYVQAPEKVTYVQKPQETVYVQGPEQVTYVQEPEETVYVQAPKQITYVQTPREAVYVQQPKGPVNVHAPENETKVAGPQGPVRIYQPERDVHIYASKAEVHLYDPAAKIHIHKPNDEIHVYELGDDAHVDAPHHLLHAHDILDAGISNAEQEPLPPYTADYEIPDTIVLNQLQKLHEMGVIKSIVEKLPDPPEYTAPTSSWELAAAMSV